MAGCRHAAVTVIVAQEKLASFGGDSERNPPRPFRRGSPTKKVSPARFPHMHSSTTTRHTNKQHPLERVTSSKLEPRPSSRERSYHHYVGYTALPHPGRRFAPQHCSVAETTPALTPTSATRAVDGQYVGSGEPDAYDGWPGAGHAWVRWLCWCHVSCDTVSINERWNETVDMNLSTDTTP